MSDNTNKEVVMRFMTEVWNKHDLAVLDELIDPTYYDYSYEPRNREGLERTLAFMQATYPNHETSIEEIIAEGDTVAVCQTLRGTHTGAPFHGISASGKSIEVGGYRFFKIKSSKITSHRGLIDLPGILRQIGTDN